MILKVSLFAFFGYCVKQYDRYFYSNETYEIHILNFITDIGGSLQKDLNVATQALEDVALESANVAKEVSKEVLNPLAKFTKVKTISTLFCYHKIILEMIGSNRFILYIFCFN